MLFRSLKKAKRLKQQFRNIRERNKYFKDAMSCDEWLSVIRRNIGAALAQSPEYLVWHVAEANNEEAFTFEFNYSDREVLTAAADVFNAVCDEIPAHVPVLFENLWWPGLRLTDVRNVKYFFERLHHKNVTQTHRGVPAPPLQPHPRFRPRLRRRPLRSRRGLSPSDLSRSG